MDCLFQRMEDHNYSLLTEITHQVVALEKTQKDIEAKGNPSICSEIVTMGRNAAMLSAEVEMTLITLKSIGKPSVDILDESADMVEMKQQILENINGIKKICHVLELSEIGNESDYYQSMVRNYRVQKSLKVVALHEQNSKLPPLKMDGDNMIYYFKDVVDNARSNNI
ncbi:uncharacterized protein LOC125951062 [Anopheles darlingi]|uniref:uncharacterized protein LOC125951062 n=1 Tax=Anopheles darlingi TaxID=43151 RepID=UPI0021002797|nr:uncharacterized protein LOC125951062 [Anopheles darlingi]